MPSRRPLLLVVSVAVLGLVLAAILLRADAARFASSDLDLDALAAEDQPHTQHVLEPTSPLAATTATPPESRDRQALARNAGLTSGIVVDARTDEPVPDMLVRVPCSGRITHFEVRTDEAGRFETPGPMVQLAELRLVALPRWQPLSTRPTPHLVVEHELRIEESGHLRVLARIGPTYRFVTRDPVDSRCRAAGHALARLVDTRRDRETNWTFVSENEEVFTARFPQPLDEPWSDSTLQLEVVFSSSSSASDKTHGDRIASPVGSNPVRYRGLQPVQGVVGIQPSVPTLDLEQQLGLWVQVVDTAHQPLDDVQVSIFNREGLGVPSDAWIGETNSAGTVLAFPLRSGSHRIATQSRRHLSQELTFDVGPGQQRAPDLVLESVPIGGTIAGRVEIVGELAGHLAVVHLRSVGAYPYDEVEVMGLEGSADPAAAEFAFDDLPACEFELALICLPELRSRPETIRVAPPAGDVVFRVDGLDDGPRMGFAAFDAESGEEIDEVEILLEVAGRVIPEAIDFDFGEAKWRLPPESTLRWWMTVDGYRPTEGDRSAFPAAGDPRIATVRLERGYGLRVLFRDAGPFLHTYYEDDLDDPLATWGCPPVAGVRVLADGERVATSDERGLATLSLSREPGGVQWRAPGWRVVGDDPFRNGRLPDESPVIVWLLRE